MTTAQPVRLHAKLSASGAHKWKTCTMAPAMEDGIEDTDSDFSREGTCAHALAELRLSHWLGETGASPENPFGIPEAIPGYEEFFDDEFDEAVQDYVDFVIGKITELRELHGAANVTVLLEQRLDFSRWVPEGFGTGDVVIIVPGKIIVIDLKFGKGIYVSGEDNDQLKLYAAGAWARYDVLYDFDEVEVWIHQPRKDNVSGETIDVAAIDGLLTWLDEMIVPRAAIAWEALNGDRGRARFHPGDHCRSGFCKARFNCAARARYELELGDLPHVLAAPDTLSVDQLEDLVGRAAGIAAWVADCKRYLLDQVQTRQVTLRRWFVGEGRSIRRITDTAKAAAVLLMEGFKPEQIYKPPKLIGLGELEAMVGKKNLPGILGELLVKPPGKPTLKPVGDDSPKVEPKVRTPDQDFGGLE